MIKVVVPHSLPSEANIHDNWRVKNKRKKQLAHWVKLFAKNQINPECLPCTVTLVRVSTRLLDFDNMVYAFKGVRDAVADMLVPGLRAGRADDNPNIEWKYDQRKTSGRPVIEITVERKASPTVE